MPTHSWLHAIFHSTSYLSRAKALIWRAASLHKCLLVTSALLCVGVSPLGSGWHESCVTRIRRKTL